MGNRVFGPIQTLTIQHVFGTAPILTVCLCLGSESEVIIVHLRDPWAQDFYGDYCVDSQSVICLGIKEGDYRCAKGCWLRSPFVFVLSIFHSLLLYLVG